MVSRIGVSESLRKEALTYIDEHRELLAETALELGNTFSPVRFEQAAADAVSAWYDQHGIRSFQQLVAPDRSNVVATIKGQGSGKSLIFNAHLDTELSGPDYDILMNVTDQNKAGGWREGDRLYGHTILNDRGLMSVFMLVGKTLKDLNIPLAGDVLLTSVVGETGMSPVDEYQGMSYEGKGLGSRYMVDHGVRADYALVAEATGFGMSWIACGACYLKITIRGRNMYTPRLLRADTLAGQPNAIVKAAAVVDAIEEWAVQYEARNARQTPCGEIRPKSQVGAIRGGVPYRPNRSATVCYLYMDVRTLPGSDRDAVVEEIESIVKAVVPDAEVECFMSKGGYEGIGVEPLADAVRAAYDHVIGGTPPVPEPAIPSMWRDINVFNSVNIPSLTFGTGRGKADVQGTGHFELDDLVSCAKMYLLTALQICG